MNNYAVRRSWDTSIKHITRHGLLNDILTSDQIATIPSSNISRWKKESDDKYHFCEINEIIKQEIELIKKLNQSSKIKKINESYFKLIETFHEVISKVKGVKTLIKQQKEIIVDTIEQVEGIIPINTALNVFNISRSTFENYKSILIHKCESSYFEWCVKRHPNQLLPEEVRKIKCYMEDDVYRYWSKASIYLKALRDKNLRFGISTFYKYCRLLGYKNRPQSKKSDFYKPVRTSAPNRLWCADVTIFKTTDNVKHHIHFLVDHYSKMILGYRIENSASATAITSLLKEAHLKYKPKTLQFLTDGGGENVNTNVSNFVESKNTIVHHVAQRDVVFSNSMVEAVNKTIKHQFLYHLEIPNTKALKKVLPEVITVYNTIRPQMSLGGNTPYETQNGLSINISRYTVNFDEQKEIRLLKNKMRRCGHCS